MCTTNVLYFYYYQPVWTLSGTLTYGDEKSGAWTNWSCLRSNPGPTCMVPEQIRRSRFNSSFFLIYIQYNYNTTYIININTTVIYVYFRRSRSIRAPPCCAVVRFISRRVRSTKPVLAGVYDLPASTGWRRRYRQGKLVFNRFLLSTKVCIHTIV